MCTVIGEAWGVPLTSEFGRGLDAVVTISKVACDGDEHASNG